MSASVSVVVCTHSAERMDVLRAALRSLADQTQRPDQVIVVIDHNDRLLSAVAAEFPTVTTVPNRRAQGLSGARNTGIGEATAEIVAFLDDDAIASPDWLEKLCLPYDDLRVMAVGGRIVPVWPAGRPTWFPEEFDWVVGCSYRGLPTERAQIRNMIGANMSFRRGVFERAGLFDEDVGRLGNNGAGCEETELCIRASRAFPDAAIIYDPDALVSHQLSSNRTTRDYFRARCLAEGKSKASVVASAGPRGVASERQYATRTLPAGVLRNILESLSGRAPGGLSRAATIITGLVYVTGSYLAARVGNRTRKAPSRSVFAPIRIMDIDLADDVPEIAGQDQAGRSYGGVFALVRDDRRPVSVREFPLYGSSLPPPQVRALLGGDFQRHTPAIDGTVATPRIRVVVATRERPEALARCLDSLLRQDYPSFEIVVVDNAATTTATQELITSRYAPTGRVTYMAEPRAGLGNAHNRGLAGNTAAIVAFTDDDVLVDPDWLRAIASSFARSDRVGCVTGLILPAELETRAQVWTERHGGFGKGFDWRVFDLDANRPDDILFPYAAGSFGSGANMAFSSSALRAIGNFDPALGAGTIAKGGDDLAAFSAVVRAGFQLAYQPGAIVWHHHRRSEEGMKRQAYGYGVGLGAYLTKVIVDDPSAVFHFARAFPKAVAHILGPRSSKNSRLPADYPRGLSWSERLGMLAGVPAYLRSRASYRRYERTLPKRPELAGPAAGAIGERM